MQANVSVVMPQVIDGLKQRMAGLHVRGTMAPGHLVFSVIDFLQQALPGTHPTYEEATCLFHGLEERWGEDFTRHVFMVKLRRGNCSERTPTMTLKCLHMLLPLLGASVQPEFRRIFEGIIMSHPMFIQ
jgi:hypothetical protein